MKKKLLGAIAVICTVALVAVILADFIFNKSAAANFIAMNTTVSLNVTGFNSEEAAEKIKLETVRLDEKLLSRTNTSAEIYAVNNGKTEVSDELAKILADLKQIEKDSGGAFCIGLGALSDLWGIGTDSSRVPTQAEIDAAITNAGNWSIDGNTVYLPEGVRLDLGAVGKGIACDYAHGILTDLECSQAIVTVGGSVLIGATDPKIAHKSTCTVAIRDPLGQANEYCAVLNISPNCVSTSGNYERYFEDENGKRYHHIFNPATGYPADSGLLSVTVVTQYGYVSDALSTACFLLGIKKSIPLLEKYNAEAVFITEDKEIITTYGESESEILTVTNDEYRLGELK